MSHLDNLTLHTSISTCIDEESSAIEQTLQCLDSMEPWVAYWLEHRTPDGKVWVRCPMPPNTLRVHSEYVLVKSVGPNFLWAESRVRGLENISLPFSSMSKLWRWRYVVSPSIVPSENFAELIRTVTCMVIKANGNDRRTSSPLPR
ncbi:hypothetical protein TNCV_96241 [Trichonephila clavipes]|nr:hypothetical protein TNCV_96241 [Trichonephila clavipes]